MLGISDFIKSKRCYYEPIFYKIEKTIGTTFGMATQTYIIPAGSEVLKYFDTQVRAGVVYCYKITECWIMLASRLANYENTTNNNKTNTFAEVDPVLYYLEVPFIQDTAAAMSDPSFPPSVDFYKKNNFENKFFMRLSTSGVGEIEDDFQTILVSDTSNENLLRHKNKFFDKYIFSNRNSIIQSYQVMRLSEKPNSITDFQNGVIYDITDNILFGSRTVSVNIRPNKKYYYVCRSQNQHGLYSNHSVVYEVELQTSSSSKKLIVNTYDIKKYNKEYQHRSMSRLLQAIPSSLHTTYEVSEVDAALQNEDSYKKMLSRIRIGEAGYPIWNEKFKIRVTSNNTGRKIDFNVVFNLIKKKTSEEIK